MRKILKCTGIVLQVLLFMNGSLNAQNRESKNSFLKENQIGSIAALTLEKSIAISGNYEADDSIIFESESNDTYELADSIVLNGIMNGNISGEDIFDWFRIITPEDGVLRIEAIQESTLSTRLYLYGSTGDRVIDYTWVKPVGEAITLEVPNLKAGVYYLRIGKEITSGESYNSYGSYELTNYYTPCELANDTESNDDYTGASALTINENETGHLGYKNEDGSDFKDWYKITTPGDGALRIEAIQESTLSSRLYLYGHEGDKMIEFTYLKTLGETITLEVPNLKAGVYYLRIGKDSNSGESYNSYGSYELTNYYTPCELANDTESNDDYTEAILLDVGENKTGHLRYKDESSTDVIDWYKFTATQSGSYTLKIEPDENLDTDPYLYVGDGETVFCSFTTLGSYGEEDVLFEKEFDVETYYVKINASGHGSYHISLEEASTSNAYDMTTKGLVKTYPSPFKDVLNVKNKKGINHIVITNVNGQHIFDINCKGEYNKQINTENMSNGLFFLYVTDLNRKMSCVKIIKY